MARETEIKFKVPSLRVVRARLTGLGARFMCSMIQKDRYFDTPGRSLLSADCGLRLRTVRQVRCGVKQVDRRGEVTFKGPREKSHLKIRAELQTRVDDPQVLTGVFEACGLKLSLVLEKRRAIYRLGRCEIALDTLPLLDSFVEIEGPDEAAVLSAAGRLGLTIEPTADHYVALAMRELRRTGGRSLTF